MVVNEVRAVSTDAHLTFRTASPAATSTRRSNVPRVTASAFLALGLATDKTTYGAGTPSISTGPRSRTPMEVFWAVR